MRTRSSIWLLLIAALALTLFVTYRWQRNSRANRPAAAANPGTAAAIAPAARPAKTDNRAAANETQTNQVVRIRPNQVLAMVNGVRLTLHDLVPVRGSDTNAEQQMSPEAYNYFLQRAINRELTMQAARARGLTLSDSQQEQLSRLRDARQAPEPGLVSKLTVDSAEIDFEVRDAEAFMLQNSLMAQSGAGADITPAQVEQYYRDHISEFGPLPNDPDARQEAWKQIDIEIRQQQAATVRQQYQDQLKAFLDQLRASGSVTVTPLPSSPADAPRPGAKG